MRVLGLSRMVTLNSAAFIAITGNGLRVSEDLARRFVLCKLDARCEDPEARDFEPGFLNVIEARRSDLLAAALTIWRWGRQNASGLQRGRPLGGFENWCAWVRDPLLTLGCRDTGERVEQVKAEDPNRQLITELFRTWDRDHGDAPVKAADLAEPVRQLIDPQGRGRQYVAARLGGFAGTRCAGFMLTRQESAGEWGAATYALTRTELSSVDSDNREHPAPMPPMTPMPQEVEPTEWTL